MVVHQKFGVIGLSLVFAVLQKLKFQIFRLFVVYDSCRGSIECDNSTVLLNSSDTYFEDENVVSFLFKSLLVNNGVSILPCVLFAAWSDKHGRKLLLSLPCIGSFLSDVLMLVLLYVPTAHQDLLLLSEGIYGFCGGTVLLGLGCLSYITDSTDHRLRTWFIGLFFGAFNTLPVIDTVIQYYWTPLEIHLDFRTLILVGISIRMLLSVYFLVYIKIFIVESVFVLGSFQGNPWANLLTPINVSDTVKCVFKRRLDNMRFYIIALSTVFVFYSLLLYGNILVFPHYFRDVFKWSYMDLIIFSSIFTTCQIITLWISTYSALKKRVLDIDLGTYGSFSLAVSCLLLTLGKNSWIAVMGALAGVASLLIPTSIVSVLSKLIERNETGSMYAGIGFLMLLCQLIAIPSYRALEIVCTEAGIPQVIFLLSFGLSTFGLLFFIYLKRTIAPELLGHLIPSESLLLLSKKEEWNSCSIRVCGGGRDSDAIDA